jgi:hypothetical protein
MKHILHMLLQDRQKNFIKLDMVKKY